MGSRFQQEKILYTRDWTKQTDTLFIQKLVEEAVAGRFHSDGGHLNVVRTAMDHLNAVVPGQNFSYEKCCDQFRKLRRRFRVYSEILKHRGMYYEEATNKISYELTTWENINKLDPLVVAYQSKGEPEIASLRTIFREDDDSVGFFDLQDITHLSSNLLGISDLDAYKYPRYGFDDQLSNSFWGYVGLPSSEGECNTSSSQATEAASGKEGSFKRNIFGPSTFSNSDRNSRA